MLREHFSEWVDENEQHPFNTKSIPISVGMQITLFHDSF